MFSRLGAFKLPLFSSFHYPPVHGSTTSLKVLTLSLMLKFGSYAFFQLIDRDAHPRLSSGEVFFRDLLRDVVVVVVHGMTLEQTPTTYHLLHFRDREFLPL